MATPNMERRHFTFIAGVIADMGDDFVRGQVARSFAKKLRPTNVAFDEAKFLRACKVEG
jgi:hypothetical protein